MKDIINKFENLKDFKDFKDFKNHELMDLGLIIDKDKKEITLVKINKEEINFYYEKKETLQKQGKKTKIDFNPYLKSYSVYQDNWFSNEKENYLNIHENQGSFNYLIDKNNEKNQNQAKEQLTNNLSKFKNIIFVSKNEELLKLFIEKGLDEKYIINPSKLQSISETNSLNLKLYLHDPYGLIHKTEGENIDLSIGLNREDDIGLFQSNSDIIKSLNIHKENYKDDLNFTLKGFEYLTRSTIETTDEFNYKRCFLVLRDLDNNEMVGYLSCTKNNDNKNHCLKINCVEIADSYKGKGLSDILYHN